MVATKQIAIAAATTVSRSRGNNVNGTYEIELYKGNLTILRRESPSSLYFPEVRSIQSGSFDQRWAGPAAQIRALPFELLAKRDARMKAGQANGEGDGA